MSIGLRGSCSGGGGPVAAEVVYDATKLAPRGLPPKHEAIPAAQEAWRWRSRMLENPQEAKGDCGVPEGDGGEDSRSCHRLHQGQLLRLHRLLRIGRDGSQSQPLAA